ncbi:DNA ligase 4 [Frieseomelitta varia]|uniref:DNA ligase 4 n=1 Tax=Frieseomelitta varia TaxID=561572 RepID=UPI001CB67D0D|nr:DNA ligase 4 [Frieseomelitta varia]
MSRTLASEIEFKNLCDVLEKISEAHLSRKADILKRFIQKCRLMSHKLKTEFATMNVSLYPILRLILPDLERERDAYNLKEKSLADLYIRVFCLGKDSKDANKLKQYKIPTAKNIAGRDFAEKAYWILQNRFPRESSNFTIERINLFLDDLSSKNKTSLSKNETFKVLFGKINALEFKWITRIILKNLKLGIGTKKILQVFHRDANSLFNVSSNLQHVCDTLYDPQMRYHHDIQVFSHFKPMLLERCQIEDIEKLFNGNKEYNVQCKYDGERFQMHMKDGKYKYFTRQGYDFTNKSGFGETSSSGFMSSVFGQLLNPQVKSVILDGELMGWHKEKKSLGSKAMSYDVKRLSNNSHYQQCFVAFDIIMYNDNLLINEPYEKRFEILKDTFTEKEGCLLLCKSTKISKSEELCKIFNESIKNKEEGVVVKECNSKYKPNIRDGTGCYKIKAEYSDNLVQDVDLIILGGYYGDGKFMGLIKSFLMGVVSSSKTPDENTKKFSSVVSVSSGLSMDKLKEFDEMFKDKWQKDRPENVIPPRTEPPDLWIRPENSIILTIKATEMIRSNDYPIGYSLRFPRVTSVRTDKPWYDACTINDLLSLIKDTGPVQKLTKRETDYEDIEEIPKTKICKTAKQQESVKQCSTKYKEILVKPNIFDNTPVHLTRLFEDKEICVINGNDELSKEQIENILLQHKAKVVQNPLKENYCIIVGNAKTAKANYNIQSKKYDIVTLDWFKRVTKEENWSSLQDFLPWDLISSRESTKRRLAQYYDDYYDHYTIDANEESLLRSFNKIEDMGRNIKFDYAEMKKADQELFNSEISPYSLFRGIVGYFNDPSDLSKIEFRFMAGTIRETIDDSVTNVFINNNSVNPDLQNLIGNKSLQIIKSKWIGECFKHSAIISYSEYLIQ